MYSFQAYAVADLTPTHLPFHLTTAASGCLTDIMKAIEAFVDGINILSVIILYSLLWFITPRLPDPKPSGPKTNKLYDGIMHTSYTIIFLLGWIWCSNVMEHVEKPYLVGALISKLLFLSER